MVLPSTSASPATRHLHLLKYFSCFTKSKCFILFYDEKLFGEATASSSQEKEKLAVVNPTLWPPQRGIPWALQPQRAPVTNFIFNKQNPPDLLALANWILSQDTTQEWAAKEDFDFDFEMAIQQDICKLVKQYCSKSIHFIDVFNRMTPARLMLNTAIRNTIAKFYCSTLTMNIEKPIFITLSFHADI